MQKKTMPEIMCRRTVDQFPRVLLAVDIDLTYRCNHNCQHCWLWLAPDAEEARQELTFDEIRNIADQARTLGTREWTISGGEPMLRPDFPEIFQYLTDKSRSFTLKTNGTLITPQIAKLLTRPGETWISMYGATPDVYDRITCTSGGFEKMMRGIALLKEAGARYVVQAFPMRDNWHQWSKMVELAKSLGPEWRIGAAWLNLSAQGDFKRNAMIASQRLAPSLVVELDKPAMIEDDDNGTACTTKTWSDCLLAQCIPSKREVHIDPYGKLSICCSVKNTAWRFDLRHGTMKEAWEEFIPSLMDKVRGEKKFKQECGSCELRNDCRWCPMYAYLEHRDHQAKVSYLCDIAKEARKFKEEWRICHRRYFSVAGIHFQVDSDLPFSETTLQPALSAFRTESPGTDTVRIRHHFSLAGIQQDSLGTEVCRHGAWTIFRKGNSWIYRCAALETTVAIGVFSHDHSRGVIYHASDEGWRRGGLNSLSLPVTDQILLARLLAERGGCIIHSAGVILDGQGWLFIGHSEAGKTTTTRLLEKEAEILCDDRNVVRLLPDGYRLFGTWCHGDSPMVSPHSAPLRAALFLKQSDENRLIKISDRKEILRRILACSIRGFVDTGWLNHTLDFAEAFSRDIPCFELHFNRKIDLAAMLREMKA